MNISSNTAKFITAALLSMQFCSLAAHADQYELTRLDKEYLDQVEQMEQDLDRRGLVFKHPEMEQYLADISERLARSVAFDSHITLRLKLLRHPVENAFALGNGSVYVNLGLISRVENETQLASVLAHEISHVLLRHPFLGYRDRVSSSTIANVAVIILGVPAEENILYYHAVNGYSRTLEKEADLKALELLANAGYDPHGMIEALDIIDKKFDGDTVVEVPIFWRDHPTIVKRKEYLSKAIEESYSSAGFSKKDKDHSVYMKMTMDLRHQACALNVQKERFGTAQAISEASLKVFPDDPLALVDLGTSKRAWAVWAKIKKSKIKSKSQKLPYLVDKAPKLEDAEQYLIKAIELDPELAITYFEMAELYQAMGFKNEPIEYYQRYLEMEPKGKKRFKARAEIKKLQAIIAKQEEKQKKEQPGSSEKQEEQ